MNGRAEQSQQSDKQAKSFQHFITSLEKLAGNEQKRR
jgi:hypothetical protein